MKNHSLFTVLFIAVIGLLIYKFFPLIKSLDSENLTKAIFFIIILIFFSYSYFFKRQGTNLGTSKILLWLAIFTALIIGYAFRFELETLKERVISVLIPSYAWENSKGELVIARDENGHFYLETYGNNNIKLKFLVDTGASDIALTKEDAIKLGFNLAKLQYTRTYSTANGVSAAAPVRIKQLKIGKKIFYNLDAHVASGDLDISLLGMSFIKNFRDFKITRDMLILQY